jgi:hypothetical protein
MNGSPGGESQPQSFELPPSSDELDKSPDNALEKAPLQESGPSKEGAAAPMPLLPVIPTTDPVKIPVLSDDEDTTSAISPSSYSTSNPDRIEKEWVDKAKAIVAKTQDDPYEQKQEMSKVKAEYIKKRFNKTIPTDDTVKV